MTLREAMALPPIMRTAASAKGRAPERIYQVATQGIEVTYPANQCPREKLLQGQIDPLFLTCPPFHEGGKCGF